LADLVTMVNFTLFSMKKEEKLSMCWPGYFVFYDCNGETIRDQGSKPTIPQILQLDTSMFYSIIKKKMRKRVEKSPEAEPWLFNFVFSHSLTDFSDQKIVPLGASLNTFSLQFIFFKNKLLNNDTQTDRPLTFPLKNCFIYKYAERKEVVFYLKVPFTKEINKAFSK
jgi:hypothetical protein